MTPISKAINSFLSRDPSQQIDPPKNQPNYMKPKQNRPYQAVVSSDLFKTANTFDSSIDGLGIKGINIEKSNLIVKTIR